MNKHEGRCLDVPNWGHYKAWGEEHAQCEGDEMERLSGRSMSRVTLALDSVHVETKSYGKVVEPLMVKGIWPQSG